MDIARINPSEINDAVHAYSSLFGEMEQVLWCLSKHCRAPLLNGQSSEVVETFIWTIRSWWGVQGPNKEFKTLLARALSQLEWSDELFQPLANIPDNAEVFACSLTTSLVSRTQAMGAARREYSLTSKVLHWLLPWRIPIYDSFVRKSLNVPVSWDHPDAYRLITHKIFAIARRFDEAQTDWIRAGNPASPLRALDKYLWWQGGGSKATAAIIRDPWKVVEQLGLERQV